MASGLFATRQKISVVKAVRTRELAQVEVLMPTITNILKPNPGHRLLDIGCGLGDYARYYFKNGVDVVAIDASHDQIALAKQLNPGPVYECVKMQDYKDANAHFDYILANLFIPYIDCTLRLIKFFKLCARVITKSADGDIVGYLCITNTAPIFQMECKNQYIHQFYEAVELWDGCSFDVRYALNDQTWSKKRIKNYHWSPNKVCKIASDYGWSLKDTIKLDASGREDEFSPYEMYIFSSYK